MLSVAIGAGRLIEVWAVQRKTQEETHRLRLPQLVRILLYGLCLFVGLIVYFTIHGYRPTELYVSTGALAAVLAFAMQQTLGDFFSGYALEVMREHMERVW